MSDNQLEAPVVSWEDVNASIDRAARATRRFRSDDRDEFASEVAARARLKAIQMLPTVAGLRSPEAYASSIVASKAKDLSREQERRRKRFVSLDEMVALAFEPRASDPSPEEALIRTEQLNVLVAAIGRLEVENPRRAQVFVMKDDGWTDAEIAAELGISSVANVAQILSRARKDLRRFLEPLADLARGSPTSRGRRSRSAVSILLQLSCSLRWQRLPYTGARWLM